MLKPDGRHLDGELVPPSRAPSRGSVRAPLVSLRVCNTVCVKRHLCRTRSYWDTAQGKCTRDMMIHAVSATVQLLHGPRRRQEAGKRGAHGIGVGIGTGIGIGIGIQSRCSDPCDREV